MEDWGFGLVEELIIKPRHKLLVLRTRILDINQYTNCYTPVGHSRLKDTVDPFMTTVLL